MDPGKDTRVLQMTTMANNNVKEIFTYLLEHGGNIDMFVFYEMSLLMVE